MNMGFIKLSHLLILCGTALLLGGCSTLAFWFVNAPTIFQDGREIDDIAYGSQDEQKLDIYLPGNYVATTRQHKNLDVIIFFYGGRWEAGSKDDYAFAGKAFNQHDYIVVIPDYRKYPDVKFPTFVEDGAKAVSWVHDNISQYGGNKKRIFVAGHSAGAHIGALIAADEKYLTQVNKKTSIIKGFAGLAGPYSFTPDEKDLKDMFGPPARYPQMQVTTFIKGKQPPMLLLHGADDDTVKLYNLTKLRDKIRALSGKVETKIYQGIDHIDIAAALSWYKRDQAPVIQDINSFFQAVDDK